MSYRRASSTASAGSGWSMIRRSAGWHESPVSWNVQGPQGSAGETGTQGPPGAQAALQKLDLVGFTAAVIEGLGPLAFTQTCQAEFPGSRWCSSEEILSTRNVPDLSTAGSDQAWTRPSIIGGPNAAGEVLDASGVPGALPSTLSCTGYNAPDTSALTALVRGGFSTDPCSVRHSVACCAVVQ